MRCVFDKYLLSKRGGKGEGRGRKRTIVEIVVEKLIGVDVEGLTIFNRTTSLYKFFTLAVCSSRINFQILFHHRASRLCENYF